MSVRTLRRVLVMALLAAKPGSAQSQPESGVLQLSVVAVPSELPLPYAVLGIAQLSLERFTDARGRIVVPALAAGTYDIVVRRLGYVPYRGQVTIRAGQPTALDVRLARVAQRLSQQLVLAARPCPNPGPPDERTEQEVFGLVSLLQENADRYRLLVDQYPFMYTQNRALGELRENVMFVQNIDATNSTGRSKVLYRTGSVVRREGGAYIMILPTILDLTDKAFMRAHCFFYGGSTKQTTTSGEETWFRLDVRAGDKLNSPDVHGSFYLDSATAQLRKMELELSRPDRLPRDLRGIASLHAATSFVEIASGISVIHSVCAVTQLHSAKSANPPQVQKVPVELQELVRYVFTSPPPDVAAQGSFPVAPWMVHGYLPRSAVWCADS